MSLFTNNKMGNFIRGGQTTIHYVRMVGQVIKQFFVVSLFIAFLCYLAILFFLTSDYERQIVIDYSIAWFHSDLFKDDEALVIFHGPQGDEIRTTSSAVSNNQLILQQLSVIERKAHQAMYYTVFIWVGIILFLSKYIYGAGRGHKEDEYVRGGLLIGMDGLKKRVRKWLVENKESEGTLNFFGFTLPKVFEPAHIMVAGDPGTGKSNLLRQFFTSIRAAKQRAIIYDRSGDFVKNFYRPGIDVILNPLDQRGANWNIFLECRKEHEFFQLANAFIPDVKSNDPFWTNAARIIFSSMAMQEAKRKRPSLERLIDTILHLELDALIAHCAGTEAQSIMTKGGEKMAISVRGVLVTHVRALKYLSQGSDQSFSIKEWVKNDDSESWIFITSNKDIHDTIKPLITSWLDIATSSILSLEPNLDRRIWTVIDELPTLNKLPAIQNTPAESRKYGGCFILGFQNYPQLLDIYGKNGADALCGSCSTSIIFRCNEPSFADWGSKQLGRAEMVETTEGISYGVNEIRDGVNLGKQKRERAIVLPTELQNLPDLQGYVKLGRGFPVGHFKDRYIDMEKLHLGYIERDDTSVVLAPTSLEENDTSSEHHYIPASCDTLEHLNEVETKEAQYLDAWTQPTVSNISTDKKVHSKQNDVWKVNTSLLRAKTTYEHDETQVSNPQATSHNTTEETTASTNGASTSAGGFVRGRRKKRSENDSEDTSSDKAQKLVGQPNQTLPLAFDDNDIEMD